MLSTNELLTPTKQFGVLARVRRSTPRLVAGWTQARGLRGALIHRWSKAEQIPAIGAGDGERACRRDADPFKDVERRPAVSVEAARLVACGAELGSLGSREHRYCTNGR